MRRRDPTANSGCINWPTHLKSSGEGGSWVFLVVPDKEDDEFVNCCINGACLFIGDLVDPDPEAFKFEPGKRQRFPLEEIWFPNYHTDGEMSTEKCLSVSLLAAVCLGTSGGTFGAWGENYEVVPQNKVKTTQHGSWYCTFDDLTEKGKFLYDSLKELYNREPTLITYIDT